MNTAKIKIFWGNAFVSCSLRDEDHKFNTHVESILKHFNLKPNGTVGRYCSSPENLTITMRKNISMADVLVVIATPRYIQKEIVSGHETNSLSEMIQVESGMAYMAKKPIIVFVQKGTNIGNFLPNITQYIELTGELDDYQKNKMRIRNLLKATYNKVKVVKAAARKEGIKEFFTGAFVSIGALATINYMIREQL